MNILRYGLLLVMGLPFYALADELTVETSLPYSLYNECPEGVMKTDSSGVTSFMLTRGKDKRCEVAVHSLLKRDTPFKLQFTFKVDSLYKDEAHWHSLFQIHSFPDKGEVWRCPLAALESQGGLLRMFSRWDNDKISSPGKWGCADKTSSIQYAELFRGVAYNANKWNTVEISGSLGLSTSSCLSIKINTFSTKRCGPNIFNDNKHPYLKFGIYKPTSWSYNDTISLSVKDVKFE